MTNNERIQARIARDKQRKLNRDMERAKQYGDFDSVVTLQHLQKSLNKRVRGTSWKGSVQAYVSHAVVKNYRAKQCISAGRLPDSFKVRSMTLTERGKLRNIQMVDIESRVIQGCLCDDALMPTLQPTLIYDNPASIKDKGVSFARRRLDYHLQQQIRKSGTDFYIATFDFKGFFDSVRHSLCFETMKPQCFDSRIIDLVMRIIRKYKESLLRFIKDEKERNRIAEALRNMEGVGITLGSQISQIMALVAPNKLDHLIKEVFSIKPYIRYMDDGVILHKDKSFLEKVLSVFAEIASALGLRLNEAKTRIVKATQGFTFLKIRYKVTKTGHVIKKIAKASIVRMRRKLKKFVRKVKEGRMTLDDVFVAFKSWLGYVKIARTYRARKSMIQRYNTFFNNYRMKGVKA